MKVFLKIAQSLDGSLNAGPGQRTTITGPEAQLWSHRLRTRVDCVLIGAGTLRVDNPLLTPRKIAKSSLRIPDAAILTRSGKLPLGSKLFDRGRKIIVLSSSYSRDPRYRKIPSAKNNLRGIVSALAKEGYQSVLIEGGVDVHRQWIASGLWDRIYLLTSPKTLPKGEKWTSGLNLRWDKKLKIDSFSRLGEDILLEIRQLRPGA